MSRFELTHVWDSTKPLVLHELNGKTTLGTIDSSDEIKRLAVTDSTIFKAKAFREDVLTDLVTLSFHFGKNTWMVEREFKDYRALASAWHGQPINFGDLSAMMRRFEISTGLELSPLQVWRLGHGISRVSAHQDRLDSNPWELADGQEYELEWRGTPRRVRAHDDQGVMRVDFLDFQDAKRYPEWQGIDPIGFFDCGSWLTMRQVDEPAAQLRDSMPREREGVGAAC